MKRSPKTTLLFLALVLTAIGVGLVLTTNSGARSETGKSFAGVREGTIVARLKDYDPATDGYSFRNYGPYQGLENSLDAGDMVKMFGAENVCQSGTTAADCVLYEPVEEWLEQQFKMISRGHCDGMAMTSLCFWLGLPFEGKSTLASWQSGAESVADLKRSEALQNYIAYLHIMQSLIEVQRLRWDTQKKKPSEVLRMLIDSMKENSQDHLELLIYVYANGQLTKGHCITPYAVEDMGEGEYRIHVYDPNFPGQSKYIEMDAQAETWRYHTAANPNETASDYAGDAQTRSFTVQNLNARGQDIYGCPFCPEADQSARLHHAAKKTEKDQVRFTMDGEGEYIITDPNGKRIGFDFAKNYFVNEIPEADVVPYLGGLGKDVPAQYHLPRLPRATKPYTITVGGKGNKQEVDADMEMTGPGFLVGFEGLLVDPGETLSMTISADGRELSFTASTDGETPSVFITIATGKDKPSYEFDIGGIKLAAGKTVTMKLDLEKQKLYFKDNDPDRDPYDVLVSRTNPNGTRDYYEHDNLDLAKKSDNYEMDFSKWTAEGDMCFEEDDEGNGFEDEECTKEPNEKKKPEKKPGAAVNYFDRRQPIAALLRY